MYGSALVGLIASIIVERPACLACLSQKAGASSAETARALERIGKTVRVVRRVGDCSRCGATVGPVYHIAAPMSGAASDLDARLLVTLLRDAALCGDCIGRRSGVPRWQVDDVIRTVEHASPVTTTVARCDACLKHTVVHRLEKRAAIG